MFIFFVFVHLKGFQSNYQQPTVVIEHEQEIISVEQRTVPLNEIIFYFLFLKI
jgi:hypothetical protein